MVRTLVLVFICLTFRSTLFAQRISDSTIITFPEVEIRTTRLEVFSSGNNLTVIDSVSIENQKGDNLGDVLGLRSSVNIKSYGPGSLATPSFRGTGASHTAVLWNGFNLQGPTLGSQDLSLIPSAFVDEIKIQHGGAGALYGSGAVGGSIYLGSDPVFEKGIQSKVYYRYGSFNSNKLGLNTSIGSKRVIASIKAFYDRSENNFPFINAARFGSPKEYFQNAEVSQKGILQENYIKIKENQFLNFRTWLQEYERQIPPNMLMSSSEASLNGKFARFSSEWKLVKSKYVLFARSAYFNEMLNYYDDISKIQSSTHFQTSISEVESKISVFKNHLLNVGINSTFNLAESDGYKQQNRQNRSAVFLSYKIIRKDNSGSIVANIRQEIIGSDFIPFTPGIGFEKKIFRNFLIKGNVAKTYRVPTFNDLFWNPGGNTDLKPEHGWSEEIGLWFNKPNTGLGLTIFNSNIEDWIIWLPAGAYWSPQNLQNVWARGVETTLKKGILKGAVKSEISLDYQFTLSTNQKTKLPNDASFRKQLIFVPQHSAQASLSIYYKKFSLFYIHSFVGDRYTTSDNSDFLPYYNIGNVSISKIVSAWKNDFSILLRANNCWNEVYQIMPWRPMPQRNYQVGISWGMN